MDAIQVILDDGTGAEFGRALMGTLPDGADLKIITKDKGTESGKACAMLTFTVETDTGYRRVQTVVSIRHLLVALGIVCVRYEDDGRVR